MPKEKGTYLNIRHLAIWAKTGYQMARSAVETISAIAAEWNRPWEQLVRERATGAVAWAIGLERHRGGLTFEQLRQKLGLRSYAAVAMRIGRLQRALPSDVELQKGRARLTQKLNVQC
jgi:hypothetical protein